MSASAEAIETVFDDTYAAQSKRFVRHRLEFPAEAPAAMMGFQLMSGLPVASQAVTCPTRGSKVTRPVVQTVTMHTQRRDAIVAPVPEMLYADEDPANELTPAPAKRAPKRDWRPWGLTTPGFDEITTDNPSSEGPIRMRGSHRLLGLEGVRASLSLAPLSQLSFIAGLSGDAGHDLVAVAANPVLVSHGLGTRSRPTLHVAPHVKDSYHAGEISTTNATRIFFNIRHGAIIVFAATQEGSVYALTKLIEDAAAKFIPQYLFSPQDACRLAALDQGSAALPMRRGGGTAPAVEPAPGIVLPERYLASMNDVAVKPFGAGQFLIFCPKDGDYAFVQLVALKSCTAAAPCDNDSDDDAETTRSPSSAAAVSAVKFENVFAHHIHLAGMGSGLEGLVSSSTAHNTGGVQLRYFTYAAFSQEGNYICATNDVGYFCAVWSYSMVRGGRRAAEADHVFDASVDAALADESDATGLDLRLEWLVHFPKPVDDEVDMKPYKVVSPGGCQFVVGAGRHTWLLDVLTKSASVIDAAPRPAGSATREWQPVVGLDASPFGGRQVYCTTPDQCTRVTLRPLDPIAALGARATLRQACVAKISAGWRLFAPLFARNALAVPFDVTSLLRYCPYGHPLHVLDVPVAVGGQLPNCPAPSREVALACAKCSLDCSVGGTTKRESEAASGGVKVLCHACAFCLCVSCAEEAVEETV
jgi:hypothetical protein